MSDTPILVQLELQWMIHYDRGVICIDKLVYFRACLWMLKLVNNLSMEIGYGKARVGRIEFFSGNNSRNGFQSCLEF